MIFYRKTITEIQKNHHSTNRFPIWMRRATQQVEWASPTIWISKCPFMIHGSDGFECTQWRAMTALQCCIGSADCFLSTHAAFSTTGRRICRRAIACKITILIAISIFYMRLLWNSPNNNCCSGCPEYDIKKVSYLSLSVFLRIRNRCRSDTDP